MSLGIQSTCVHCWYFKCGAPAAPARVASAVRLSHSHHPTCQGPVQNLTGLCIGPGTSYGLLTCYWGKLQSRWEIDFQATLAQNPLCYWHPCGRTFDRADLISAQGWGIFLGFLKSFQVYLYSHLNMLFVSLQAQVWTTEWWSKWWKWKSNRRCTAIAIKWAFTANLIIYCAKPYQVLSIPHCIPTSSQDHNYPHLETEI